MRFKTFVIVIFISLILISSCSLNDSQRTVDSGQFLPSLSEEIDYAEVYCFQTSLQRKIMDQQKIDELISVLSGYEVEKLSPDDEIDLFENGEMIYSIFFSSSLKSVGAIVLFSSGEMIVFDTDIMNGEDRTKSYIYKDETSETFEDVFRMIELLFE